MMGLGFSSMYANQMSSKDIFHESLLGRLLFLEENVTHAFK